MVVDSSTTTFHHFPWSIQLAMAAKWPFFDVAQVLPLRCTALHYLLNDLESLHVNCYLVPTIGDCGRIRSDLSPKDW